MQKSKKQSRQLLVLEYLFGNNSFNLFFWQIKVHVGSCMFVNYMFFLFLC